MRNQSITSDSLIHYGTEKNTLNHRFNQSIASPQTSKYINYDFRLSSLSAYAKHPSFFKSTSSIYQEQDKSDFYKDFVLITPKGVVADDCMFVFNIKEYTYLGVMKIDFSESTKTMVSMTIRQYIDTLVSEHQILTPSVILKKIQEFIYDVIQYDSLDHFSRHNLMISLACIDKLNKQIMYSGSHKGVFLTLNDCVYDVSSEQPYEPHKGMQQLYFKDYVISLSSNDANNKENFEDYPIHLYFSNLLKNSKSIN